MYEFVMNVISGLLSRYLERPVEWTLFIGICIFNLLCMIMYVVTNHKKYIFIAFAGIIIAIWIMLYLVVIQNYV